MKIFKLIIFFSAFSTILFGQKEFVKNNVFIEIGGNGFLASVNYERQLTNQPRLGIRLGIGNYSIKTSRLTIPFGINYLINLKNNQSFLDFGLGITWTKSDVKLYVIVDYKDPNYVNTNYYNVIPSLGFRRLTQKNLMWRISLTPVINQNGFLPFLGFSIGKQF